MVQIQLDRILGIPRAWRESAHPCPASPVRPWRQAACGGSGVRV